MDQRKIPGLNPTKWRMHKSWLKNFTLKIPYHPFPPQHERLDQDERQLHHAKARNARSSETAYINGYKNRRALNSHTTKKKNKYRLSLRTHSYRRSLKGG